MFLSFSLSFFLLFRIEFAASFIRYVCESFRSAWRVTGNTIKKHERPRSVIDDISHDFTSHHFPRLCDFTLSHSHSRSSLYLSVSRAIHTFLPLPFSFDCASSFAWLSDPVSLSHSLSPSKNFVSSVSRKNVIECDLGLGYPIVSSVGS